MKLDALPGAALRASAPDAPATVASPSSRAVGAPLPGARPIPTDLGGMAAQILDDVVNAPFVALQGLGRNLRARTLVDTGLLQAQLARELEALPAQPALALSAGQVQRRASFLMPPAVESTWKALAATPGAEALVHPTKLAGQPFYALFSRAAGAPDWRAEVRAKNGDLVATALATEDAAGKLSFAWVERAGRDPARPTRTLDRFSVERFWDADSTPPALAALSRVVGKLHAGSGARTPAIEAGIVMASLMHDVAYYYGGSEAQKSAADTLFGAQIPYFVGKLDPASAKPAELTAAIDVDAVAVGGGWPFSESFSWSYGLPPPERGFHTLAGGEATRIRQTAREVFREVVDAIAEGRFQTSDVLKEKLKQAGAEHGAHVVEHVKALAHALRDELRSPRSTIPGFER